MKIVGAAYLVYVGISLLRSSGHTSERAGALELEPDKLPKVFLQGFLTNVLNPKVALFFLAFLPQFVDADAPNKPLAFLFLGAIFNLNGTLCNLLVAWSAARVTGHLGRSATVTKWLSHYGDAIRRNRRRQQRRCYCHRDGSRTLTRKSLARCCNRSHSRHRRR